MWLFTDWILCGVVLVGVVILIMRKIIQESKNAHH